MNNEKEKAVYALADILVREIVKEVQNEQRKAESTLRSPNLSKTDISSENLDRSHYKQGC